mmetsp:Transcript_9930/g.11503  ORF Transcript_9930/g.11503 Transcript_9930/m.11503 type:complete len:112 (+) Transcript_9930:36-371(+)
MVDRELEWKHAMDAEQRRRIEELRQHRRALMIYIKGIYPAVGVEIKYMAAVLNKAKAADMYEKILYLNENNHGQTRIVVRIYLTVFSQNQIVKEGGRRRPELWWGRWGANS